MRPTEAFLGFNDEQCHALDGSRNLAVRANAGSGKTSVLVERVVQLFARSWDDGTRLPLSSVVALTFTRKAAAELRERLRASFAKMVQRVTDEAENEYWARLADDLPRATIGTIDSFCARVLREFGYADDAPVHTEPDFEPLEEYDEALLKTEAVERVLDRLSSPAPWEKNPQTPAQSEACRWWGETQGYDALAGNLTALLDHTVEPETITAAHAGVRSAAERVAEEWESLPAVRRLRHERATLLQELQALEEAVAGEKRPGKRLQDLRERVIPVRATLATGGREGDEAALRLLREALLTDAGKPRTTQGLGAAASLVERLQASWSSLLAAFEFDFEGEVCALDASDRLVLLLGPAHAEYLRLCHEEKRFDFLTLARRTRDLLRASAAVRGELKDRYRYVLVDEFQDTNQLQWEIIEALVASEPGQALDTDRLFIVGDPQQSIYRFRHADVGVFARVSERVRVSNQRHGREQVPTDHDRANGKETANAEQRLGLMPLGANYRTLAPVPLLLLDDVFRHVFGPARGQPDSDRPAFEIEHQPLTPGWPADKYPTGGEIRYVIPDDDEAEPTGDGLPSDSERAGAADELGPCQVRAVVDQLCSLRGQPRLTARAGDPPTLSWGDMAVLLPSRSVVLAALEKEFRVRGVPFVVAKGIGFWQRQEVRDLVNLAACLADAGDELSLFAVLRGPLGQRTDTEVLFLSQLGQGSIAKGLPLVEGAGEQLAPAGGTEPGCQKEHWDQLGDAARATLEEYWIGLTADARERLRQTAARLARWRRRADCLPHAELLQQALEECGAYAIYAAEPDGDLLLANVRRLIDRVRDFEARSSPGLARLARRLCSLVEEATQEEQATLGGDQDAVQVMTVHAAKGLEFPVVAVLKMERRAERPSASRIMVKGAWDDLLPGDAECCPDVRPGTVSVCVRHPRRPREMYSPRLLLALRRLNRAQDLAESRRLFYVAATRAKERLILAGKPFSQNADGRPAKVPECWQKWFEEALGVTEVHKGQGIWEDPKSGCRVQIVTTADDPRPETSEPPPAPAEPIDLEPIRETPVCVSISANRLLALHPARQNDPRGGAPGDRAFQNWTLPEPAEKASVLAALDPALVDPVVAAAVQRFLTLLRVAPPSGDLRLRLLRSIAANLQSSDAAALDDDVLPFLAIPAALQEIAETAATLIERLGKCKTAWSKLKELLAAPGVAAAGFGLRLGRWRVFGSVPRLIQQNGGYEIVTLSAGIESDETHQRRARLYSLALYRAGRAELAGGKLRCYTASLQRAEVQTLTLTANELDEFATEIEQDLAATGFGRGITG